MFQTFDMDNEVGWDVSQEAESLNTSLFGGKKKTKKQSKGKDQASSGAGSLGVIYDSDDEVLTKKETKKMKEKRRKDKKQGKVSEEPPQTSSVSPSSPTPKLKKGKEPELNGSTDDSEIKKKKKKKKKAEDDDPEKKVGKRKRESSEMEDDDDSQTTPKKKSKKVKTDTPLPSPGTASSDEHEKKKRKRHRKKKNNSKKNKYAHLALNRNEKEKKNTDVNLSTTDNAKSSAPVSEPKKGKKPKSGDIASPSANMSKKTEKNNGVFNRADEKKAGTDPAKAKQELSLTKAAPKKEIVLTKSPTKSDTPKEKKKRKSEESDEVTHAKKPKGEDPSLAVQDLREAIASKSLVNGEQSKKIKTKDGSKKAQVKDKTKTQADAGDKEKSNGSKANGTGDQEMIKFLQKQNELLKALSKTLAANTDALEKNEQRNKKKKKDKNEKEEKSSKKEGKSRTNNVSSIPSDGSKELSSKKTQKNPKNPSSAKLEMKAPSKKPSSTQSPASKPEEVEPVAPSKSIWGDKNSNLAGQAREKLNAARFRYLNEQLYTCEGKEALQLFRQDREAFKVYHTGFENQAAKWPVNPVNIIVKQLKDKSPDLIIADFGCGDAKLAQTLPQKVHSFDLVALNPRVTACDMTKVPLQGEIVDVAVFCLSLMGTNLQDYIREANRVLKTGGLLKIVEVVSRFNGLSSFLAGVCSLGFQLLNKRDVSEMFYMMDFKKVKAVKKGASTKPISLKACVYKRR